MSKLKMWKPESSWEDSEKEWEQGAKHFQTSYPIKTLKHLPNMVGITPEAKRFLRWKAFKWIIGKDEGFKVLRKFFIHPFRYTWGYLKSLLKPQKYVRDGDLFLYGLPNIDTFQQLLESDQTLLLVGFSYCHKPLECPSGRFNDQCIHDAEHPVCRQCFIGKALHALPEDRVIPLIIPTIHYIGDKVFDAVHQNPDKKVIFLITACEMTLEMFSDWGNMVGIQGVGVRLDGRICNTLEAFALSEKGIKPGLTVVREETKKRILDLIRKLREFRKA
ncbi:MAG: hypothetical protein Tsb0021_15930 [Chlamydiales bacterium]